MILKDYFQKIKEAREAVELIKLVEEEAMANTSMDATPEEIQCEAERYLQQLLSENVGQGSDPEVRDYGVRRKLALREALHRVADVVVDLEQCDGMTMEFLFNQPSHGEWLTEISEEV